MASNEISDRQCGQALSLQKELCCRQSSLIIDVCVCVCLLWNRLRLITAEFTGTAWMNPHTLPDSSFFLKALLQKAQTCEFNWRHVSNCKFLRWDQWCIYLSAFCYVLQLKMWTWNLSKWTKENYGMLYWSTKYFSNIIQLAQIL